jgi:hypothetical protein
MAAIANEVSARLPRQSHGISGIQRNRLFKRFTGGSEIRVHQEAAPQQFQRPGIFGRSVFQNRGGTRVIGVIVTAQRVIVHARLRRDGEYDPEKYP